MLGTEHQGPQLTVEARNQLSSAQFSSVQFIAQSCPTLCDPMGCSMPGFPVRHQLVELAQTQSVMPLNYLILCCPLLLLPSILPSIRVFSNELVLRIKWPKYWSFNFSISPSSEYSGLISFRMHSPCSPRESRESSPTPQFKSINSVLSFLYDTTLPSTHDHWKNHRFD